MERATITVDDAGVRRTLSDGKVQAVTWEDLMEVSIVTTSDGPFAEDVFFVLVGRNDTGCVIPHGAPESEVLMQKLGHLPGFDYEPAIRAMSSAVDAKFVCWRRSGGTP